MLGLDRSYEGFENQAIQKRMKTTLLLGKENSNRAFHRTKEYKNPTTQHSISIKKRIASQKGHSTPELKNAKKKRNKTSSFTLKYQHALSLDKELKEIENSICRLTQKLKEESDNDSARSQNHIAEQIFQESCSTAPSINYKSKNNKEFGKRKLGMKNKFASETSSSHIHKYNNDQERSRIKNSLEPIRALTADNIVGMLTLSNNKLCQNGIGSRKLKKIHDRLDRVREFIRSINDAEMKSSICSDGMNHKDAPHKKNGSSDSSEGADTKGNDHYRNIQHIVKTRRIVNRNRLFASRPPLLETVVEEPEKEEEEAKLYETL